jgi:hypothetical protein
LSILGRALASPILGARKSRPGSECPGDPLFVQGVQRTRLAEAAQRPIFIPDGRAT